MATLAGRLASLVVARANCEKTGNVEWHARHTEELMRLAREALPSGSGIDSGCTIVLEQCTARLLTLHVPFHCMDENGFYDGWRDYRVIVAPVFDGISVKVIGQDYNGLKDYLGDLFHETLSRAIAG